MTATLPGRIAAIGALLLAGCAAQPPAPPGGPPPAPCTKASQEVREFEFALPDAEAQGALAVPHPVNRLLSRAGSWRDAGDGWSALELQLHAPGARALSVQLGDLALPARTEIWFCGASGADRHGPYRQATGGELWTPAATGPRALLQVLVPGAARSAFEGRLREVQATYR